MPTFSEAGKDFVARIERVVTSDQSYQTKGLIKEASDLASSHEEGKGPVEIARVLDLGLGRKQVARVLADAKPADEEGPKPIPFPRRPSAKETFRGKTGDTA